MSDRLEKILDECIDRLRSGESIEAVLQDHADVADELRPLLEICGELEKLPEPRFSEAAPWKIVARILETKEKERPSVSRFFASQLFVRVAAVFIGVILLGWGMMNVSASAVPGDLLYPVKRLSEGIRYYTALRPEQRINLHISFAEKRLAEVTAKLSRGDPVDKKLLVRMLDEAQEALEKAKKLPDDKQIIYLSKVGYLMAFQKDMLKELMRRAPIRERRKMAPFIGQCGKCLRCMGSLMKCKGFCPFWTQMKAGQNRGHEKARPQQQPMTMQNCATPCPQ